eukprot:scaffold4884_cov50-Attheya_sp.AAC.3
MAAKRKRIYGRKRRVSRVEGKRSISSQDSARAPSVSSSLSSSHGSKRKPKLILPTSTPNHRGVPELIFHPKSLQATSIQKSIENQSSESSFQSKTENNDDDGHSSVSAASSSTGGDLLISFDSSNKKLPPIYGPNSTLKKRKYAVYDVRSAAHTTTKNNIVDSTGKDTRHSDPPSNSRKPRSGIDLHSSRKILSFATPNDITNLPGHANDTHIVTSSQNSSKNQTENPSSTTGKKVTHVELPSNTTSPNPIVSEWKTKSQLLAVARKYNGMAIQYRALYHPSTAQRIKDHNTTPSSKNKLWISPKDLIIQSRFMCVSGNGGGSTYSFCHWKLPGNLLKKRKSHLTIYKSTRPVLCEMDTNEEDEVSHPRFFLAIDLVQNDRRMINAFISKADAGSTPAQYFQQFGEIDALREGRISSICCDDDAKIQPTQEIPSIDIADCSDNQNFETVSDESGGMAFNDASANDEMDRDEHERSKLDDFDQGRDNGSKTLNDKRHLSIHSSASDRIQENHTNNLTPDTSQPGNTCTVVAIERDKRLKTPTEWKSSREEPVEDTSSLKAKTRGEIRGALK